MQPTDYALGLLFAAWLDLAGWGLVTYGIAMCLGGIVALVVVIVQWGGVTLGPDPEIPPAAAPPQFVVASPHPEPNCHRADADTHVIPRIPGATPEAGPVCPVCGGPFHPVCPSKERTDETVQLPPVAALAPQFAALRRYLDAIDETAAVTDEALHRIVDKLTDRADDCPLTTQEIPPLLDAPEYDAAIRATDTRELSEVMKKVCAP